MSNHFGVRQGNVKMDSLRGGCAGKRPASISPRRSGSHDVAEPPECDTACHTHGEEHESGR
jgi:hypothetical protein